MHEWPDAPAVRAFLARAARRLAWRAAIEGAAAGLAVALGLLLITGIGRASVTAAGVAGAAAVGVGAAIRVVLSARVRRRVEYLVERRAPECRNLIITAAELVTRPVRVRAYIGARVCRDAAHLASRLDLRRLFPAGRQVAALAAVAVLWTAGVVLMAGRVSSPVAAPVSPDAASLTRVDVVVTPPEYTGRPPQSLRDPSRVEAIEGSRIRITAVADATTMALETMTGRQPLAAAGARTFSGELTADADGFIALEPASADGHAGVRRLIGLSVTPDLPPRVRLTAPGHDLFFPDSRHRLDLTLEADDDLALSSLRVRYTKVAGADENFTFTEGEVTLDVSRTTERAWTAKGALALESLRLTPGDMVVYRGIAADRRPGVPPVESDTFIVEITEPGSIAAEGFAIDDEMERYALSQQMVILKTERLSARRAALPAADLNDESQNIAVEQRRVRAEFVFMMGGELAEAGVDMTQLHEEEEAAGESDLAAGRNANQGRIDLLRAIRSMSLASTSLVTVDLTKALVDERAALASLQKAFARSRYILRALTERERLDLSRRLTGVLAAVTRDARPEPQPPPQPRLVALRRALAGIAALAGAPALPPDAAARAATLAQTVLGVDPSAAALQQIAAALAGAAAAIAGGRTGDARSALDAAATGVAAAARAELLDAPREPAAPALGRLDGALADALRRLGPPR